MNDAVEDLIQILNLENIEENLFRGHSPDVSWQRVFGGQVIGQALVAAYRTVENRICHSLHAYFIRPGDPKVPIVYEVDRSRDGKRSEEHTSELQSLMRISYAVFCLKKKNKAHTHKSNTKPNTQESSEYTTE